MLQSGAQRVMEYLMPLWKLMNEMAPYLLLGFLFAGVLHVVVPRAFYRKYFSNNSLRSVFYASLFGIPLPLCSCGVIPTDMSLRREGASSQVKQSVIGNLLQW